MTVVLSVTNRRMVTTALTIYADRCPRIENLSSTIHNIITSIIFTLNFNESEVERRPTTVDPKFEFL